MKRCLTFRTFAALGVILVVAAAGTVAMTLMVQPVKSAEEWWTVKNATVSGNKTANGNVTIASPPPETNVTK